VFTDSLVLNLAAKSYPPRGDNGLHELHQKVCQSTISAHHKLSVLYYLLLDHDDILGVRSQLAEQFCQKTGIPNKYQILMKGLWHMDRQQFPVCLPSFHPGSRWSGRPNIAGR